MLAALPAAGFAQQAQEKDQPAQAQSDNQNDANKQGRRGAMMRQRQHMNELAQKLGLTDAQKQQFMEISRDSRRQAMAIRHDSSMNDDQKKEKMQAVRKQQHQQMFSVLTPEQKEKLKAMRKKQQEDKDKKPGDQASAKKKAGSTANDDDDPFAGMTSDDDGPGNGGM